MYLRALLLILLFSSGCAANPARGVASTGAPLRVQTEQKGYNVDVPVGTEVYRNASGAQVGSSQIIQTQRRSYTDWKLFQGDQELDELDFYRIAGDRGAVETIESARSAGKTYNRIGWGVLGIAAASSGLMFTDSTGLKVLGGFGMVFGTLYGGTMAWSGHARVKRQKRISIVSAQRAAAAFAERDAK